jgi:thioredoxin 1
MNTPMLIKDADFEPVVLKSKLPVMLEFWQLGCGPCQMVEPVLEEMASRYDGKLLITKMDVDDNMQVAGQYGVLGAPTIFMMNKGRLIHRINGYLDINALKKEVERFVSKPARSF